MFPKKDCFRKVQVKSERGFFYDRDGQADVFVNMASTFFGLREYQKSSSFYEQALAIHQDLDDKRS